MAYKSEDGRLFGEIWLVSKTNTYAKMRSLVGKMGKDKTIIVTNNWMDIKVNNGGI